MRIITKVSIAVAAMLAVGAAAYASTSGSSGTIHACASRSTGVLRLGHHCRRRERAVTWNKAGPSGTPGPSDAYYSDNSPAGAATVTVPPGEYVATGNCTAFMSQGSTSPPFGEAELALTLLPPSQFGSSVQGNYDAGVYTSVPDQGHVYYSQPSGYASMSDSFGYRLPNGGTITARCGTYPLGLPFGHDASAAPVNTQGVSVTAIRVGTLHVTGQ